MPQKKTGLGLYIFLNLHGTLSKEYKLSFMFKKFEA